jgi:hypothetical protein
MQAAASAGSIGHGANRERHCNHPATPSSTVETPKLSSLCSESHIRDGKVDTKPASEAPAPTATMSAGSAQQSSVEVLANSETNPERMPTMSLLKCCPNDGDTVWHKFSFCDGVARFCNIGGEGV